MTSRKRTQMLVVLIALVAIVPANAQGTYTVLYTLQGGTDGSGPSGPLWFALVGTAKVPTLYGTTVQGGNGGCYGNLGCGTVFQVNANTHNEKVLWRFQGGPNDGNSPIGGVVKVGNGFFGNTNSGGSAEEGAVYKLSGTTESPIASLSGTAIFPSGAMVWNGTTKTLYGTAGQGGNTTGSCGSAGCGSVFTVNATTGAVTTLHQFAGMPSDGAGPWGLIRDAAGNLYGVTSLGGGSLCNGAGCGTIFEITAAGKYRLLHSFAGGTSDGWQPGNGLVFDSVNKILYGSTEFGGANSKGIVFSFNLGTRTYAVIYNFGSGENGIFPRGGLVLDSTGHLWGLAAGGSNSAGIIFELINSGGTWGTGTVFSFPGGTQGVVGNYGLTYDSVSGNFYGTAIGAAGGLVFQYHP